jgi:hypothetical protein
LDAAARFADQNAAHDGFVLRRILADNEYTSRTVEAAAMEDRTPLKAELV